jgi:hypothetical protein
VGLNPGSSVVFGDYGQHPITSEGVVNGADLLTLTDGTTILFEGIDHKIFNGLGA